MIDIQESVFVEDDPSRRCRVYPTKDFHSYRQCDDQFIKDYVSNLDPPITPVWLTNDADQVTKLAFMKSFGKIYLSL